MSRFFLLLVVLIWAASVFSVSAGIDPNALFQQALLLETKGEYAQAVSVYQQMMSQYPDDPLCSSDNAGFRVKLFEGKLAVKNGDLAKARAIATEIKSLNSSASQKPSQLFLTGLLFEDAGSPEEALSVYQQMMSQYTGDSLCGPDNAGFRVKLFAGKQAVKNGDFAKAKAIAAEIKSLNSSASQKPSQLYLSGFLLEDAGFPEEALSVYQQMISQYPDDSLCGPDNAGFRVKLFAGKLAVKNGDFAKARAIAAEIKSLNSSASQKPSQLFLTGLLFEDAGSPEEALSVYQQMIKEYPDDSSCGPDNAGFRVKLFEGKLAVKKGDFAKAKTIAAEIKSLNASVQQKPSQLLLTGFLLEDAGSPEEALSVYQQMIKEYPDDPSCGPDNAGFRVKLIAGKLAVKKDDFTTAKIIAAEIISLNSSAQQKPYQLYLAGLLFEDAESLKDAQSVYQQMITEYPDSMETRKAKVRNDGIEPLKDIQDGNIDAAISGTEAFKAKYTDGPPELTDMLFKIGEAYYMAGMKNSKDEFFHQSVGIFEKDIVALDLSDALKAVKYYVLGLNYERLGDYAKAAQAFADSYQLDSKFKYADYCLFAQGYCFEQQSRLDPESQSDAKSIIRTQYQQMISEFPQSDYAVYAREWLENNK